MPLNIAKEIAALNRMTVRELRQKHLEVFGDANRSRHKEYLIKRIAWRLQANAEGTLSERARKRAAELADDSNLRTTAPRRPKAPAEASQTVERSIHVDHDHRLPMPGSQLRREYKGETIVVNVLRNGFEYEGEVYRSLSAIARQITGSHWNGYNFFGLKKGDRS
ncbi:MAG: hypothetical protein CMJ46_13655 [Planctomyces sp.]|nr:hypothetical protein [Planctomyces sp.]